MFILPVSRDARQLSRLFDDTFDRFFSGPVSPVAERTDACSPALDVSESDSQYTVRLDLPGVAKGDVKVSIEGRAVSVSASVSRNEEVKEGERVIYRERSTTQYSRGFTLAAEVDAEKASARLEHGVLTLVLPKRNGKNVAQLTVN